MTPQTPILPAATPQVADLAPSQFFPYQLPWKLPRTGYIRRDSGKSLSQLRLSSGLQSPRIEREASGERGDVVTYFAADVFGLGGVDDLRDQTANLAHLAFFHPARRDCGRADAQARRHERFILIERNRVLVDGD